MLHRRHCLHRQRASRGFTLLELLVVMVIVGQFAGYVGPKLFGQIGTCKTKAAKAQIDAQQKALDQYRIDTGRYPNNGQGLLALVTPPDDEPRWSGSYLAKTVPGNPWGRAYEYRSPGQHNDCDLLSHGRDGRPAASGTAPTRSAGDAGRGGDARVPGSVARTRRRCAQASRRR